MGIKLLAVGDMHLGRLPSRLPESISGDTRILSPVAAWDILVDQAIKECVDVVVFSGDVVNSENDFFEAYRLLSKGIKKLTEHNIRILGIAGNHDVYVLPRLVKEVNDFQLIGSNGSWESVELEIAGQWLTIHGYSFSNNKVCYSPLKGSRFERGKGLNLGLLHCDRDQQNSPYAPVTSFELIHTGLDGWLLGHIHIPDNITVDHPSGYLGCISSMDRGERGDRGPWLFSIDNDRIQSVTQWVIAPLRWDNIVLDISDVTDPQDAYPMLLGKIKELDKSIKNKKIPPKVVVLRLCLQGRTCLGKKVQEIFENAEKEELHIGESGTRYFFENCVCETKPKIPLEELSKNDDPPGLLARLLLLLKKTDSKEAKELIIRITNHLNTQLKNAQWNSLNTEDLDLTETVDLINSAGFRLLEEMLGQNPEIME